MTVIGVAGKSGSGKTSYCREQAEKAGGTHIEVDEVCHDVIERHREELCAIMGMPITATRREIGERAFVDREKYSEAVRLIWPDVEKAVLRQVSECRERDVDVLIDFILLPKSKALMDACDVLVKVDAPLEVRKQRVIERDGISPEYFDLRESTSMDYDGIAFDHVEET